MHLIVLFVKSSTLSAADDTPVWRVARYTSAAPTYFTECDEYVDGGLMANNPSQEGLKAIRDFYPSIHIALVVSLGTGKYDPEEIKQADVLTCLRSYRIGDAISGLSALIKSALQVVNIEILNNSFHCTLFFPFPTPKWLGYSN